MNYMVLLYQDPATFNMTDAERSAYFSHDHVWLARPVRQEVELAKYVDDAAGPGARPPRGQRAWALA